MLRVVLLFLVAPMIGCMATVADPSGHSEQVSQSPDAVPYLVCSEPAITGGDQAEASSIECWRLAPEEPLF